MILSDSQDELVSLFQSNERLVFSQPNWFQSCLELIISSDGKKYKIAEILIKFGGARIPENLARALLTMIDDGAYDLFKVTFSHHLSDPVLHTRFPAFVERAINSEQIEILEYLISREHIEKEPTLEQVKKMAVLFLRLGNQSSLDRLLSTLSEGIKRIILRDLVKYSASPDRFNIVKMAVEAGITFVGIDKKVIVDIATTSAELGCIKTTESLLKNVLTRKHLIECIKTDLIFNPLRSAITYGHRDIENLYNFYLNK